MKIFAINEALAAESSAERIYPDYIPAFADRGLDQLYGSLYASMPQLQCDRRGPVHTYAAWRRSQLSALLMYCTDGQCIQVLNEGMHLPADELDRFAHVIFTRHTDVSVIKLHALSMNMTTLQHPSVCMATTEDIVINLPDSEQAYLAQLGKSSRKALRQNLGRAQKDLSGFHHALVVGEQITDTLVDQIIHFNHARLALKQQRSAIDAEARAHLMQLLRARGWVGIVRTDNQICAGTLGCRFGHDVYSLVNAHDPRYDHYSMGNLSRHLLINASIRAGASRFHLLGGQLSSKRHALARRHTLCELRLYRSRLAILNDIFGLSKLAQRSAAYHLRTLLEDMRIQPQRGAFTRLILGLQKIVHALRRRSYKRSVSSG